MGGHHNNSCNYSSGSSGGGGPAKRHRDHSPNGNDSDDDVDLLMDDANGSGPLSPGAESLIDSDNSSISLTSPPSPVDGSANNHQTAPSNDLKANHHSPPSNSAGQLNFASLESLQRDHHQMALSSGLIAPPPHHPSAFSFSHHPHHPSFGESLALAALY